tara:strand:- start:51 stop:194 length:144 start_codon:yes stop_codon:yes gene_type:complete
MMEILRHMLGICGEHWHPSILSIFIVMELSTYIYYIHAKIKSKKDEV